MNTDDHIIDANGSWSSPQEALEWYRRELATTGLSRESWKAGMQWAETQLFWFESAFRNVVGVLSDHAAAGNANPAGIDMAALTVSLLGPPDDAPLPPGLKITEVIAAWERANGTCVWQQDGEGSWMWKTKCGQWFSIDEDGSPSDCEMAFCCFCGLRLQESLSSDEDEAEEGGR